MSGDHNQHQKPRSYLDDFGCPRCGHCCKTDLARVGEVGVWGEWVGLTDEEKIELWNKHENHWRFEDNLMAFTRAIEAKLKEKNHG